MSTAPAVEPPPASEAAFAGLYERHAERIFAFCRRRLRSQQEAEDAVQETFVSAMRAIRRGSVPVCETAWLFKIAENVCFAVYRSNARRPVRDLSDSERLARLAARDGGGEALFGLEEALGALPRNQRHAFVLRELRGLSYKEIAIQLGVSVASVETLIYRARRGLARALETGAGVRGRVTATLHVGSIAATVKGWLAGAATVKVASAAAAVAIASLSVGDAPPQPRARPSLSPTPAALRTTVHESVLWGARRSREGAPITPAARPGRAPGMPRPRPEPRQPRPLDVTQAPSSGAGAAPEVMPVVRSSEAPVTEPALPVNPAPKPPVSAPPAPQLPSVPPVTIPDLPVPLVELPAVPNLPQIPVDVPDVGELLPVPPALP